MNADIESAGALLTAGLAAHEIDGHAPAPSGDKDHAGNCANCATPLAGNFCHGCGQRGHLHSSLVHLGEEVVHGILHFDAKAWRTLPLLVTRPGELTRRYIDGHRTRFVSPLALFLFMIFFLFFVGSTLNKGNVSIGGNDGATTTRSHATAEAGKGLAPDDRTGVAFIDNAIDHAIKNPELAIYKLKNTAYKYSFLLVPISLPFLWLMFFWRRGVTMYDHAVFSLYSLSFMSLLFATVFVVQFAGLPVVAPLLVLLAPPVHMFLQLRGAYRLTRMEALWRTAALQTVAACVFTVYLALILFLSI